MALRPSAARPEEGSRTTEPSRRTLAQGVLIWTIACYRYLISPALPPRCRFLPTCSAYALEAVERHGALRGSWLALRRVARCHPFGGAGLDPVPARRGPAGSRL